MIYLLDSNVWISLIRGTSPKLAVKFQAAAPAGDLCVCAVVRAELRYGCTRSAKPAANFASLQALIAPFPSLPFDDAAADQFAAIRRALELAGAVIGPYDLQIAAIALANDCTLVTHNTGEFSRVTGLRVEDWETT